LNGTYDLIMDALPASWKYTIMGTALVNDLVFNTTETIKVVYDYKVVYEALQGSVAELRRAEKAFRADPVKNYEDFAAKKEVFLLALRLELGYMEELCKAVNEANLNKFWSFLNSRNKVEFDGEKNFNSFATYLNDAVQECYNVSVLPFV